MTSVVPYPKNSALMRNGRIVCSARDIVNYSPDKAPKTGSVAPVTRSVHKYESDEMGVILHDSEGYEVGSEKQKYYKEEIIGYVDECNASHSLRDMDTRIHETWYCVSAGSKKFFDVDISIINNLRRRKIPVCVVITKVDCIDRAELDELIQAVKSEIPDIDIFTYASLPDNPALKEKLINTGYIQQDALLHWAAENLDDSLRNGLLASVNGAIGDKHAYVFAVNSQLWETDCSGSSAAALQGGYEFTLLTL